MVRNIIKYDTWADVPYIPKDNETEIFVEAADSHYRFKNSNWTNPSYYKGAEIGEVVLGWDGVDTILGVVDTPHTYDSGGLIIKDFEGNKVFCIDTLEVSPTEIIKWRRQTTKK